MGVLAVYFLDYTMGCGWWTMVLSLILVLAVLLVRGKPYAADNISSILLPKPTCCSGTICPESSDPFYTVSYYIKWVTTSWTHSTPRDNLNSIERQTDSTPVDKYYFSFTWTTKGVLCYPKFQL